MRDNFRPNLRLTTNILLVIGTFLIAFKIGSLNHHTKIYQQRKKRIMDHISSEDYPKLTDDELNALKALAAHLYLTVQSELEKSLNLFKEIDVTLVKGRANKSI